MASVFGSASARRGGKWRGVFGRACAATACVAIAWGALAVPAAHAAEAPPAPKPAPPQFVDFTEIARQAEALAAAPYKAPVSQLPDSLESLKFAGYQNVRQREDHFLWRDVPGDWLLGFYHQGMHFKTPVRINEIGPDGTREIGFDPAHFDYGGVPVDPAALKGLGYAGFKLLYPLNSPAKRNEELASFLGASYFRMMGRGQVYGISARGLALDTALASGEEFPAFREFWIRRPTPGQPALVVYALLDSPRATGAYRFDIRPGATTEVMVRMRVYLRAPVGRLGIAPLTSMYLYGANQPWPKPNYRPEIHDSDGLAIHTGGGEWLWRPLNNPRRLAVSAFAVTAPRGFGLLQRAREFSRYEDLDDRYEKRPSLWIEPVGDWGKGSVQLVEIPTRDETNDNIVAFWVPDAPPAPGQALDLSYRMSWTGDDPVRMQSALAHAAQTRRSREEIKGPDLIRRSDGSITYVIDFVGPALRGLAGAPAVEAWSDANGEIVEQSLRANDATGGQRLQLRVMQKDPTRPVELRARLAQDGAALTETWTYQVPAHDTDAK